MARLIIKLRNGNFNLYKGFILTYCGAFYVKIYHVTGGSRLIANLPDGSKRRFDDLMSHRKEIIGDDSRMQAFDAFFGVLQDCFENLGGVPPKGEVLDLYGRVTVNSFNLMNDEYQSVGIALYLEASAFDHSCKPNATVAFDGKKILIRCISDGLSDVSKARISYCHLLHARERRRKDLKEQYYFDCECEECEDDNSASEALKIACMRCPNCSEGVSVKESSKDVKVECQHCDQAVSDDHVRSYWTKRDEVIDAVYKNKGKHPEPMEMSYEFAQEMRPLFYPTERNYLDILEHCFETYINQVSYDYFLQTFARSRIRTKIKNKISNKIKSRAKSRTRTRTIYKLLYRGSGPKLY